MPVFVIAPLVLNPADQTRLAVLRRDYDPQAELVEPHVTMVFAIHEGLEAEAVRWARLSAQSVVPQLLSIGRAVVARDYEKSTWYVFLMPKRIPAELADLHRRLHAGPLGKGSNAPFDAHVMVGRFDERVVAEAVAREINEDGTGIGAGINALAVLRFDGVAVKNRTEIPLGGRRAS